MSCHGVSRGAGVALCVLALAPFAAARSQASPTDPGLPVCPAGAAPIVDTATVTVVITPGLGWNRRVFTAADRQRLLYYADAIRQHFTAPPTLGVLPTLAELPNAAWGGAPSPHSAVGGQLILVLKSNGRLREAFWQVLPFSRNFAIAVHNATIVADTSHDFDGIPRAEPGVVDDTMMVQMRTVRGTPAPDELPLMRAQLVSYRVQRAPSVVKEGGLYYPMDAGDQHVGNDGEMLVLIGSNGTPVMPYSQITRLDWRDFMSSMRNAVENSRYQPAQSGGCAVPSLMVHRFTFRSER